MNKPLGNNPMARGEVGAALAHARSAVQAMPPKVRQHPEYPTPTTTLAGGAKHHPYGKEMTALQASGLDSLPAEPRPNRLAMIPWRGAKNSAAAKITPDMTAIIPDVEVLS